MAQFAVAAPSCLKQGRWSVTYVLSKSGRDFWCNEAFWSTAFDVAVSFGWHPAGTENLEWEGKWNGGYFSADGQELNEHDAKEFGAALGRACSALETLRQGNRGGISLTLEQERSLLRFKEKNVIGREPSEPIYDIPVDEIRELSKIALGGSFSISTPL
jgi:hypothetical protein